MINSHRIKLPKKKIKFFLNNKSENVEKEIYKCKIYAKKFKAFNFIVTHIKNKYIREYAVYTEEILNKFLMEENFNREKEKFNKSNIIETRETYEEELAAKLNVKNNYISSNSIYGK